MKILIIIMILSASWFSYMVAIKEQKECIKAKYEYQSVRTAKDLK